MMIIVKLWSHVLIWALLGCQVEQENLGNDALAIINGRPSPGDHHTLAYVFDDGSYCTGTLVSPRVMVTAAHCFDTEDALDAKGEPTVHVGAKLHESVEQIAVTQHVVHQQWQGTFNTGGDIALILLARPHIIDHYPPVDSQIDPQSGDDVRRIGYGAHVAKQKSDGERRTGLAKVTGRAVDAYITINANTCSGDSGGPVLFEHNGIEYLVGTHSYGMGQECGSAANGSTMLKFYADNFIAPFIREHDSVCMQDFYCNTLCDDDPDCGECGDDGVCTENCQMPDPDCPSQQLGENCQRDSQCTNGACVPWEGTRAKFCVSTCDDTCGEETACQSTPSHGAVCYPKSAPQGVLGDACDVDNDCGSHLCIDNECSQACVPEKALHCPSGYDCESGHCIVGASGPTAPNQQSSTGNQESNAAGGCEAHIANGVLWWLLCMGPLCIRRRFFA